MTLVTYRMRLKDKHAAELNRQAGQPTIATLTPHGTFSLAGWRALVKEPLRSGAANLCTRLLAALHRRTRHRVQARFQACQPITVKPEGNEGK